MEDTCWKNSWQVESILNQGIGQAYVITTALADERVARAKAIPVVSTATKGVRYA